MKKTLSLFLLLAMLLTGMVSILSSCGSKDDGEAGADIHLFLSSRIYDFDPTLAIVDDEAAQILSLMYEPLFRLKKDGSVALALAEDYKINKSERTMTITIRDTNWSDSKPVTSNDVAYAWKRILEPTTQNPAAVLLYDIENAVYVKQGADASGHTLTVDDLGVETPDDETLIIHFRKEGVIDYDAFLRNLSSVALAPVPEDVVGIFTNSDNWSKQVATIVTNGPFTLKAIDHFDTGEFALQRNRYYRRDKDSDTPLTEYVVPQFLSSVWAAEDMTGGQYESFFEQTILDQDVIVHFSDSTKQYADSFYYISDLPLDVRQAGTFADNTKVNDLLSVSTCVLNTKYGNPVLANTNIRLALSAVIDREDIAKELVYARPATGYVTPGLYNSGSTGDFRQVGDKLLDVKADTTKAEQLLAKGMAELKISDKSKLGTLRIMYSGENFNDSYVALYLESAWENLGFDVELDPLYGETRVVNDTPVADSALQFNYNAQWNDIRLNDEDIAQAEQEGRPLDLYADVILVDSQMLTKDAFAPLCAFSSTMSGNGFDMTDNSQSGQDKEYSYELVPHVSGYVNANYDAKIQAAFNAANAEDRAEYLHEAEEQLLADMPIIPLVFNQDFYVISDKLSNVTVNEYGYPVFTKANLKEYEKLVSSHGEEETTN